MLPNRHRLENMAEPVIELIIRLCGISAIILVFGIFFFVFREGASFFFTGLDLIEFITSPEWFPSSVSNKRYGVLALAAGVVAGVGLGAALTQAPWSQSVAPGVPALPAILATLALPQPVDLAAAAEPGVRQSYAIRTAAFETLRPADATAALIRELGADVAVAPLDGDAPRYVIWIGPYASLADARLMETVVKRRLGFLDARIVAGGLPSGRPR